MSRENITPDKIALLATGDEISNGDILNTNSQEIAQRLFNNGMHVGVHMTTSDTITEIEQAISYLLQNHRALIITGGLGPTSDDLTRYALAKSLNRELIFDDVTWDLICERLMKFGYNTPPQSNRQQALYPEGAVIIPNPNGTAGGCMIQHKDQWIFMLPGPPPECLPMIETTVLPNLKQAGFQHILHHKSWMLFGVSEGQIAEELDKIAQPFNCTTGYRLFYPYIEFKIYSNHKADFDALIPLIEQVVAPYLISAGKKTASTTLIDTLKNLNYTIGICDLATGGSLESIIQTPENYAHVRFSHDIHFSTDTPYVVIKGLNEFWMNPQKEHDIIEAQLEITFVSKKSQKTTTTKIPFRGKRVKQYAVEFICHQISNFINEVG